MGSSSVSPALTPHDLQQDCSGGRLEAWESGRALALGDRVLVNPDFRANCQTSNWKDSERVEELGWERPEGAAWALGTDGVGVEGSWHYQER